MPLKNLKKKISYSLQFDEIKKHVDIPMPMIAEKMNVRSTPLMRKCRELKPYQNLKSLRFLIDNIEVYSYVVWLLYPNIFKYLKNNYVFNYSFSFVTMKLCRLCVAFFELWNRNKNYVSLVCYLKMVNGLKMFFFFYLCVCMMQFFMSNPIRFWFFDSFWSIFLIKLLEKQNNIDFVDGKCITQTTKNALKKSVTILK